MGAIRQLHIDIFSIRASEDSKRLLTAAENGVTIKMRRKVSFFDYIVRRTIAGLQVISTAFNNIRGKIAIRDGLIFHLVRGCPQRDPYARYHYSQNHPAPAPG